jgi:hypothetical protein
VHAGACGLPQKKKKKKKKKKRITRYPAILGLQASSGLA